MTTASDHPGVATTLVSGGLGKKELPVHIDSPPHVRPNCFRASRCSTVASMSSRIASRLRVVKVAGVNHRRKRTLGPLRDHLGTSGNCSLCHLNRSLPDAPDLWNPGAADA